MEYLKSFFENEGIEYYAVLAYSDVREINAAIRERSAIEPKSVIIFLMPYFVAEGENLSAYATSLDYHICIREITEKLISRLKEVFPDNSFRGFGDHSPIDECGAALSAGLGVIGKNGLIINEKYGSYIFIADVVTDVEPHILGAASPSEIKKCIGCDACLKACPTGILRGECDSCLSAITQRKGELTDAEQALMIKYNTAWGCDICQSVCPYNKSKTVAPLPFFRRQRVEKITVELIQEMSKSDFEERAFAWRGRKTVLRNAEILEAGKTSKM